MLVKWFCLSGLLLKYVLKKKKYCLSNLKYHTTCIEDNLMRNENENIPGILWNYKKDIKW